MAAIVVSFDVEGKGIFDLAIWHNAN